jgi:isoleucyl-tRNA synthetase
MLDQWILSRLFGLIRNATKMSDLYDITGAGRAIERFVVEDMSNWWIRRSRERFQRPASRENLEAGLSFFRYVLSEVSKLLAPFTPFLADHIYKKVNNRKESVHLEDWPKAKKKLIKPELEAAMFELRNFVADGLAQRKANNIKVRQPLRSLEIVRDQKFEAELETLLKEELNVKEIAYAGKKLDTEVSQDTKITSRLNTEITRDLLIEGYAREVMRQIQDMRKEAGYRLDETVYGGWETANAEITAAVTGHEKEISDNTLLKEFGRGHNPEQVFDVEKEFELGPQAKVWLGVRSKK